MKKEDIQTKIDAILDNLEKLNSLKTKTFEDFISDFPVIPCLTRNPETKNLKIWIPA